MHRAADHQGHEIGFGERRRRNGRHEAAVFEHRDGVAETEDLLEPVADVENRFPARAQIVDQRSERIDLGVVERRGRLVEDEHGRVGRDALCDLDQLLLRDRQARREPVRRDREADALEHRARVRRHLARVERAARERLAAEIEILGHREIRQQREFLEDGGNAAHERVAGSRKRCALAAYEQVARIGPLDAGEQLHERRFAGAVLARDGVNGTGAHGERDVGDGFRRPEALTERSRLDRRAGVRRCHAYFA